MPAPEHHCHAEGCDVPVRPRMFSCRRHWSLVPRWLQTCLWKVYEEGQEVRKQVTPMYLLVQTRCRLAIAEAERNSARTWLREDIAKAVRQFAAPEHRLTATDEQIIEMLDTELRRRFLGRSS